MKILKPISLSLLLYLHMQIDSFFLTKLYDLNKSLWGTLQDILPIVFAIVVYIIFRTFSKREFWTTIISFTVIYVISTHLDSYFNYSMKLLNLMNVYQDPRYSVHVPLVNFVASELNHIIAYIISSVIYLVRHRKIKLHIKKM